MKLNILILTLFTIILLSISVNAETNYTSIGGGDGLFTSEVGIGFYDGNDDITLITRAIGSTFVPLVADLDGDGVNEIVVFDNGDLNLYHGSSLLPVDSITVAGMGSNPFMELFDIDGDGYIEAIIGSNTDI